MPDSVGKAAPTTQKASKAELDSRLAEESFAIHLRYGGDYMDEIPITGKPGEFHFASTGRTEKLAIPQIGKTGTLNKLPALDTKAAAENPLAKNTKADKTPKSGTMPGKLKRRKSKSGTLTPS